MRRGAHVLALAAALLALWGCSLGGRFHLGDAWLEAGHGLALMGNHVTLAIH